MTVYLDTSDLVKLYVDEPGAGEIAALVGTASVVTTSVIAYAEARAAFTRRRRERLLTSAELRTAVRHLDADWPRLLTIGVDDELARAAGRLAERHGVRGADAIHLAAFEVVLMRSEDADLHFSTADKRLARAARALR